MIVFFWGGGFFYCQPCLHVGGGLAQLEAADEHGEEYGEKSLSVVAHACGQTVKVGGRAGPARLRLSVVHDELDPVPEAQAVHGEHDAEGEAARGAGHGAPQDARFLCAMQTILYI